MKLFSCLTYIFVSNFLIRSPLLYGMENLSDSPSSDSSLPIFSQLHSSNSSASNNTSFLSGLENTLSFTTLPVGLINQINDYLDFRDQFNLAQTNRNQLFFWASVGRVPQPEPVVTTTPDVTYLNWNSTKWPTNVNRTLVIHVDTNRNIERKEIEFLDKIENLEKILHLHFKVPRRNNFFIDINPLITNEFFSLRFSSLQSLNFRRISPSRIGLGSSLPKLQNFIIQGDIKKTDFPAYELLRIRKWLKKLYFINAQLKKATLPSIIHHLQDYHKECSRLVEIRDNHLDLDGNPVHFEEPWYEGIDFILRPWTLEEDGNARIGYETDHFVPGPARIRHLDVRLSEGSAHVPWYRFFHFLSPAYFSVTELLPLFRAWSTEDRLTALTRLIPESRIEQGEEGALTFVLPSNLQQAFDTFWQTENNPQTVTSQQQPENISVPQSQEASALDETIQVAASRYSAEVAQVSMRNLIEAIRENAQSHPAIQSLLAQLPPLETARETLLSWFREAMEHFSGDTTNDTKEPNTAEVLVGTQLMTILRSLGKSFSS